MDEHRIMVEADQPTGIEVKAAAPGDRCVTCGQPARYAVVVTRPDMPQPRGQSYCAADADEGAEALLGLLAIWKQRKQISEAN